MKCIDSGPFDRCEGGVKLRPSLGGAIPKVRCDKHWHMRITQPMLRRDRPLTAWEYMDRRPLRRIEGLDRTLIPTSPGVYAFYLHVERLYVGKATSLRSRVWGNHLRTGKSMTNSAFRRNVATHLGIATAANIKAGRYTPTDEDAKRVTAFVAGTEIAWVECASEAEARLLEEQLRREYLPALNQL